MSVVFSSDVVASEEYKRKLEERLDAIEKRLEGLAQGPTINVDGREIARAVVDVIVSNTDGLGSRLQLYAKGA